MAMSNCCCVGEQGVCSYLYARLAGHRQEGHILLYNTQERQHIHPISCPVWVDRGGCKGRTVGVALEDLPPDLLLALQVDGSLDGTLAVI